MFADTDEASPRHCEQSEAIQTKPPHECFRARRLGSPVAVDHFGGATEMVPDAFASKSIGCATASL